MALLHISWLTENARMRINKDSYWKIPKFFLELSGEYRYQRGSNGTMQKAKITEFQDKVEKVEIGPFHLVDVKVPIDPLLLKQNKTMKKWMQ